MWNSWKVVAGALNLPVQDHTMLVTVVGASVRGRAGGADPHRQGMVLLNETPFLDISKRCQSCCGETGVTQRSLSLPTTAAKQYFYVSYTRR